MSGDVNSVFLDTNMLVYSNVLESPLHQITLNTIQTYYDAGTELWVSRQVLREFMAVLTRPQSFSKPLPIPLIIDRIRSFQMHFHVAEDGPKVTEALLSLVDQFHVGGSQIHDANIVATMQVYGIRNLLTHNIDDFKRFSGIINIL
jgi:predicted nucleic acid-binding protein